MLHSRARRRARLTVEALDERVVPAYAMTIDGDFPTFNVSQTSAGGVTTFTANGPGANVRVDELMIALTIENVVVTSGTGGGEDGSITWTADSANDYPSDFLGPLHSLTFRPGSDSTQGDVWLDSVSLPFNDNVNLTINTSVPAVDGDIHIANDARIVNAHSLTMNAGTGTIVWESANPLPTTDSGDVHINAAAFVNAAFGATLIANTGNLVFDAPIDVNSCDLTLSSLQGSVTLNQPVDDSGTLTLFGLSGIAINADIGTNAALDGLILAGGTANYGSRAITATNIQIAGDQVNLIYSTLSGTGDLTGDLEVGAFGALAPAGVGAIGSISLFGNLTIDGGGMYAVDVGATADQVNVGGDVFLQGAILTDGGGIGPLTAAGDVAIITPTGDVFGQFDNATLGTGLFLGGGPVQVTNYGPPAPGITIAQILPATGGVVSGADADGTTFTVKLTGPGQLIGFEDATNALNLIVTGGTIKSFLTVATKVNASDDVIKIGDVRITGSLGGFAAPTGSVTGAITATVTIKAISVLNALNSLTLGGVATDTTTIKALDWSAGINMPGVLSTIKVANNFVADVNAAALGKATVGLTLSSGFAGWNIANGIASITAGLIANMNLTANFVGTISVKGDSKRHLAGDVVTSTFTTLANDGNPKTNFGLKTLTVAGTVQSSSFNILAGNVKTVKVGRFLNSNLYLDYTAGAPFSTGTFNTANVFTLGSFTTTAATGKDATNPSNWAFANSQIAADTIVSVRLSGLRTGNGGNEFGIAFRTAGGSVQTKSADVNDPINLPLNANLTPGGSALAGDFFFLDL